MEHEDWFDGMASCFTRAVNLRKNGRRLEARRAVDSGVARLIEHAVPRCVSTESLAAHAMFAIADLCGPGQDEQAIAMECLEMIEARFAGDDLPHILRLSGSIARAKICRILGDCVQANGHVAAAWSALIHESPLGVDGLLHDAYDDADERRKFATAVAIALDRLAVEVVGWYLDSELRGGTFQQGAIKMLEVLDRIGARIPVKNLINSAERQEASQAAIEAARRCSQPIARHPFNSVARSSRLNPVNPTPPTAS